ncbi:MAG: GNAT family N-acetyltransferase [Gammaproteobacteria bacterium]|nr:GNAT family N-acetyltransferase [Gammaproteobacteria bacterium]
MTQTTTERIRDAMAADATAACSILRRSIAEICASHYQEAPQVIAAWLENKTEDNVRSWLTAADSMGWIAELDRQPVGFSMLSQRGEILLLYLVPEALGRGLGHRLLQTMENTARELKLPCIKLHATRGARTFYARHEYQPVDIERFNLGEGLEFEMTKQLGVQ